MYPPENNPFMNGKSVAEVAVVKGNDPYLSSLEAMKSVNIESARGKSVLIKPNAGRVSTPGAGVTTDPRVVAAVIDAFKSHGAEVAVGESPITGVEVMEALEVSGIAAVARERKCPLLDMDKNGFDETVLPWGKAVSKIKVCSDVFRHDIIVSVPVMKVHMHTGVTLSVKNMKGCLWKRSKVDLHMLPPLPDTEDKSLDTAIADMSGVLRPHLAVIDGTVGMEGLGPSAGTPRELGVVVVGSDPFAADAVACSLMGKDAAGIPHLRIGAERGYGTIVADLIKVSPASWRSFAVDFEPPPKNLSIKFPNVNVLDRNSCSACQSTVLLFLQRYGKQIFDYFPDDMPLNIAIGKGHKDLPENTLCIGNCTAALGHRGIFVPGCPPVASAILKAVTRNNTEEESE